MITQPIDTSSSDRAAGHTNGTHTATCASADAALAEEAVRVPLPTPFGVFDIHAFERGGGHVYVAMVRGEIGDGENVLARLHSECLTGDALGSLRCDCGVQLRRALRMIAAEGRGVLVYATGHEGRGIGLINKLRAYVAQERGADTVDANTGLGLPVDARDYADCAAVLSGLGVRSVRLVTNNPSKVAGLTKHGIAVSEVVPVPTAPHHRNLGYLTTKAVRMDHVHPTGATVAPMGWHGGLDEQHEEDAAAPAPDLPAIDVTTLLGTVRPRAERPYVVVKYAQTLDGRIATATGDSKWISGEPERAVSHALRAACDAVLVGANTVINDDPELTVRMVAGASPQRIVLDSTLRIPLDARVLRPEPASTVITTDRADPDRVAMLREHDVRVEVVPDDGGRVSLAAALRVLRDGGIESVLVEGGSRVITALLAGGLVDRFVVSISPVVVGSGTEAIGGLGIDSIADGTRLTNRTMLPVGDDIILAGDLAPGHDTGL